DFVDDRVRSCAEGDLQSASATCGRVLVEGLWSQVEKRHGRERIRRSGRTGRDVHEEHPATPPEALRAAMPGETALPRPVASKLVLPLPMGALSRSGLERGVVTRGRSRADHEAEASLLRGSPGARQLREARTDRECPRMELRRDQERQVDDVEAVV